MFLKGIIVPSKLLTFALRHLTAYCTTFSQQKHTNGFEHYFPLTAVHPCLNINPCFTASHHRNKHPHKRLYALITLNLTCIETLTCIHHDFPLPVLRCFLDNKRGVMTLLLSAWLNIISHLSLAFKHKIFKTS